MTTESSQDRRQRARPRIDAPGVRKTMKRFVLAFFLVAAASATQAQQTVLAPDGALFTIDVASTEETGANVNHLVLRVQRNAEIAEEVVPASVDNSRHAYPAIAYDPVSDSVFVFWLRHVGTMSSQLTFATRSSEGDWSEPKVFGDPFIFREHLRIAVTGRVSNADGTLAPEGAISVHLVWWEFDSHTGAESARYAMVPIENGGVVDVIDVNLTEFVDTTVSGPEDLDLAVLKQSLVHASTSRDSVLVTFGDLETRSFHQVRFNPRKVVSDVRIRIPIGRAEGPIGAPRFVVNADARIEGVHGENGLALYVLGKNKLRYVTMNDGAWSETRTITLDELTSSEMVLGAIRRLVSEQ